MTPNIFSRAFLDLATRLGIDAWAEYESKYLEYARKKRFQTTRRMYNTGRSEFLEDPRKILQFYNNLETKPSLATIMQATAFFKDLTKDCTNHSERVKAVAAWVNKVTVYITDKDNPKWRKIEYWSSAFDLWEEYLETGKIRDDCDGYAAIIWWGCVLAGVPKQSLFIRAGMAVYGPVREGHANVLYLDVPTLKAFYVEGSFYGAQNQNNWGRYEVGDARYPDTWFLFNDEQVLVPA